MNKRTYKDYASARAAKSDTPKNCLFAFLVGGGICAFAEAIKAGYLALGTEKETAAILVPCTLILLTAILTGLDLFDGIAKHAGAGTLVPITGFANAVVSPAMDSRKEGLVPGLGVRIFSVAGPVILYGTLASVLYGTVYCLCGAGGAI
ncbi:MAG: SpoVA/SpoVAEb family sporulation membrane protein [Lachnospiraceae bacterium]|nr:SpoVA/SpoVAEb family sporulation membrane protein [Lachnospiraceae bacterium]